MQLLVMVLGAAAIIGPSLAQPALPAPCVTWSLELGSIKSDKQDIARQPCIQWQLTPAQYLKASNGCRDVGSVLVLELWSVFQGGVRDNNSDVYLAVSRSFNPTKTSFPKLVAGGKKTDAIRSTSSQLPQFNPPLAPPLENNSTSIGQYTYVDVEAIQERQMYHRIAVPINANETDDQGDHAIWQISIISTAGTALRYWLLGQCVPRGEVPCPRPSQDGLECSGPGRGQCQQQNESTDVFNPRCVCRPGFVGEACQTRLTNLTNRGVVSATVAPLEWQYFIIQTEVIPPHTLANPVLLVEMNDAIITQQLGDPKLFLKQLDSNKSIGSQLPDRDDGEPNLSFYLNQRYHFKFAHNYEPGSTFVVAVYNSGERSSGRPSEAQVMIRARWSTDARDRICPLDCSGKGQCFDPAEIKSRPILNAVTGMKPDADFFCGCDHGVGGSFCEGSLEVVPIYSGAESKFPNGNQQISLGPRQWHFYKLEVIPEDFDMSHDIIRMDWEISIPSGLKNDNTYGLIIATEDYYPLEAIRGDVRSFGPKSSIVNPGEPLQLSRALQGSNLNVDSSYIISIYSLVDGTFTYSLVISVPTEGSSSKWGRPYASLLVVCLVLILALTTSMLVWQMKRRGVWMWRGQAIGRSATDDDGDDVPNVSRGRARGRQRGVPADIVQSFESYQYKIDNMVGPPPPAKDAARGEEEAALAPPNGTGCSEECGTHQISTDKCTLREEREKRQLVAATAAAEAALVPGEGDQAQGSSGAAPPLVPVPAGGARLEGSSIEEEDDEVPSCTVCLCEYEEGDFMRRLPCGHEFHRACVDKWMSHHTTCPVCRTSLLPPRAEGEEEEVDPDDLSISIQESRNTWGLPPTASGPPESGTGSGTAPAAAAATLPFGVSGTTATTNGARPPTNTSGTQGSAVSYPPMPATAPSWPPSHVALTDMSRSGTTPPRPPQPPPATNQP